MFHDYKSQGLVQTVHQGTNQLLSFTEANLLACVANKSHTCPGTANVWCLVILIMCLELEVTLRAHSDRPYWLGLSFKCSVFFPAVIYEDKDKVSTSVDGQVSLSCLPQNVSKHYAIRSAFL